jgi:16S rRNA (uracil1498-N3)-methyltransferase
MPKHPRPRRRQTVQSNTYRFFVDADALHGRAVVIEDAELAHQLGAVLRLRAGERVLLLDNSGWQYVVALDTLAGDRVAGTVERKELAGGEPRTKLTLYVALLRPDRFEWILQKGTELGVSAFVPVICERSTIGDADELSERKLDRWRRIMREAAEQSRRGKLPRLAPALFFTIEDRGSAIRDPRSAILDPRSSAHPFSIALFSGPEGGFSASEFETASRYGMIPVTLGPRTLRAETAPLVAASAILYEMGDLE